MADTNARKTSLVQKIKQAIYKAQIKIRQTAYKTQIPIFFIPPIIILWFTDFISFQAFWKGRAPYLIFIMLTFFETITYWKEAKNSSKTLKRKILLITVIAIPTIYVIAETFLNLKATVINMGQILGVPTEPYGTGFLYVHWPISFEYLVIASSFIIATCVAFGPKGLKQYSLSSIFLFGTGLFYTLDTFYPFGTLQILQSMVPVTTYMAVVLLNLLGYPANQYTYNVTYSNYGYTELLTVLEVKGQYVIINWPCAGINSLFIFTLMILLYIKNSRFSTKSKIIIATVGAIGTFFVNVIRIAYLEILYSTQGPDVAQLFHDYYSAIFYIVWFMAYILLVTYANTIKVKIHHISTKMFSRTLRKT